MAERRMFSCKITSSDAFKMMSLAAQALYFHLGMEADDDGFVNNPISITRSIGATQEALEELVARRFVLRFTDTLVVIKHWKINNWVRKDMYKETAYQQYKEKLHLKENGAYTEKDKSSTDSAQICDDSVTSPLQDRDIGKDRLGKDRLGKYIDISDEISHSPSKKGETPKTEKNPVDYERIMNLFNEICTGFPKITKLSDRRRRAIRARLNGKYSLDDIERAFRKAQASDFLKGANDHNWSADFDWIINDSNMAKILDGNYDNGKASMKGTQRTSMFDSGIAADGGDREKFKNAKTMLEIYREKQREEARRAAR